jgi:hypothetical protein
MKTRIVLTLITLLSGCASTLKVLENADAACADVNLEGRFTDSRAVGRILKVPEGTEVNQALITALCPP